MDLTSSSKGMDGLSPMGEARNHHHKASRGRGRRRFSSAAGQEKKKVNLLPASHSEKYLHCIPVGRAQRSSEYSATGLHNIITTKEPKVSWRKSSEIWRETAHTNEREREDSSRGSRDLRPNTAKVAKDTTSVAFLINRFRTAPPKPRGEREPLPSHVTRSGLTEDGERRREPSCPKTRRGWHAVQKQREIDAGRRELRSANKGGKNVLMTHHSRKFGSNEVWSDEEEGVWGLENESVNSREDMDVAHSHETENTSGKHMIKLNQLEHTLLETKSSASPVVVRVKKSQIQEIESPPEVSEWEVLDAGLKSLHDSTNGECLGSSTVRRVSEFLPLCQHNGDERRATALEQHHQEDVDRSHGANLPGRASLEPSRKSPVRSSAKVTDPYTHERGKVEPFARESNILLPEFDDEICVPDLEVRERGTGIVPNQFEKVNSNGACSESFPRTLANEVDSDSDDEENKKFREFIESLRKLREEDIEADEEMFDEAQNTRGAVPEGRQSIPNMNGPEDLGQRSRHVGNAILDERRTALDVDPPLPVSNEIPKRECTGSSPAMFAASSSGGSIGDGASELNYNETFVGPSKVCNPILYEQDATMINIGIQSSPFKVATQLESSEDYSSTRRFVSLEDASGTPDSDSLSRHIVGQGDSVTATFRQDFRDPKYSEKSNMDESSVESHERIEAEESVVGSSSTVAFSHEYKAGVPEHGNHRQQAQRAVEEHDKGQEREWKGTAKKVDEEDHSKNEWFLGNSLPPKDFAISRGEKQFVAKDNIARSRQPFTGIDKVGIDIARKKINEDTQMNTPAIGTGEVNGENGGNGVASRIEDTKLYLSPKELLLEDPEQTVARLRRRLQLVQQRFSTNNVQSGLLRETHTLRAQETSRRDGISPELDAASSQEGHVGKNMERIELVCLRSGLSPTTPTSFPSSGTSATSWTPSSSSSSSSSSFSSSTSSSSSCSFSEASSSSSSSSSSSTSSFSCSSSSSSSYVSSSSPPPQFTILTTLSVTSTSSSPSSATSTALSSISSASLPYQLSSVLPPAIPLAPSFASSSVYSVPSSFALNSTALSPVPTLLPSFDTKHIKRQEGLNDFDKIAVQNSLRTTQMCVGEEGRVEEQRYIPESNLLLDSVKSRQVMETLTSNVRELVLDLDQQRSKVATGTILTSRTHNEKETTTKASADDDEEAIVLEAEEEEEEEVGEAKKVQGEKGVEKGEGEVKPEKDQEVENDEPKNEGERVGDRKITQSDMEDAMFLKSDGLVSSKRTLDCTRPHDSFAVRAQGGTRVTVTSVSYGKEAVERKKLCAEEAIKSKQNMYLKSGGEEEVEAEVVQDKSVNVDTQEEDKNEDENEDEEKEEVGQREVEDKVEKINEAKDDEGEDNRKRSGVVEQGLEEVNDTNTTANGLGGIRGYDRGITNLYLESEVGEDGKVWFQAQISPRNSHKNPEQRPIDTQSRTRREPVPAPENIDRNVSFEPAKCFHVAQRNQTETRKNPLCRQSSEQAYQGIHQSVSRYKIVDELIAAVVCKALRQSPTEPRTGSLGRVCKTTDTTHAVPAESKRTVDRDICRGPAENDWDQDGKTPVLRLSVRKFDLAEQKRATPGHAIVVESEKLVSTDGETGLPGCQGEPIEEKSIENEVTFFPGMEKVRGSKVSHVVSGIVINRKVEGSNEQDGLKGSIELARIQLPRHPQDSEDIFEGGEHSEGEPYEPHKEQQQRMQVRLQEEEERGKVRKENVEGGEEEEEVEVESEEKKERDEQEEKSSVKKHRENTLEPEEREQEQNKQQRWRDASGQEERKSRATDEEEETRKNVGMEGSRTRKVATQKGDEEKEYVAEIASRNFEQEEVRGEETEDGQVDYIQEEVTVRQTEDEQTHPTDAKIDTTDEQRHATDEKGNTADEQIDTTDEQAHASEETRHTAGEQTHTTGERAHPTDEKRHTVDEQTDTYEEQTPAVAQQTQSKYGSTLEEGKLERKKEGAQKEYGTVDVKESTILEILQRDDKQSVGMKNTNENESLPAKDAFNLPKEKEGLEQTFLVQSCKGTMIKITDTKMRQTVEANAMEQEEFDEDGSVTEDLGELGKLLESDPIAKPLMEYIALCRAELARVTN